jgi:hypothetical protein
VKREPLSVERVLSGYTWKVYRMGMSKGVRWTKEQIIRKPEDISSGIAMGDLEIEGDVAPKESRRRASIT